MTIIIPWQRPCITSQAHTRKEVPDITVRKYIIAQSRSGPITSQTVPVNAPYPQKNNKQSPDGQQTRKKNNGPETPHTKRACSSLGTIAISNPCTPHPIPPYPAFTTPLPQTYPNAAPIRLYPPRNIKHHQRRRFISIAPSFPVSRTRAPRWPPSNPPPPRRGPRSHPTANPRPGACRTSRGPATIRPSCPNLEVHD